MGTSEHEQEAGRAGTADIDQRRCLPLIAEQQRQTLQPAANASSCCFPRPTRMPRNSRI